MAEQPSYLSSTLSLMALSALATFAVGIVIMSVGVIWFKLPVETAEKLFLMYLVLVNSVVNPYLTARGTNGKPANAPTPPTA